MKFDHNCGSQTAGPPSQSMLSRRTFLATTVRTATCAGVGAAIGARAPGPAFRRHAIRALWDATAYADARPAAALAHDETYWGRIRQAFDVDSSLIYLNSAGCSPTPRDTLDGMVRDLRFGNRAPVQYMWHTLEPRVEVVRRELATEFGCDLEELAVTRNASEANEIVIMGLDLRAGDEVIVTTHNYDRMLTAWDQRARREGVVVVRVPLDVPPPSDGDVLDRIRAAVSPRTRVIELPQLTNWTGQPLPIADVTAFGRAHGIEVLVDGAQAFAHTPTRRDALQCDYYGASLHKWLLAPVGTGFLYVRRDRLERVWPLMPAPVSMRGNVRKFEEIGTHPAANHNAILAALTFHRGIGGDRKLARLRALRDRWARTLASESDRVHLRTPLDDPRSGALALMEVDGLDPVRLHDWLWARHRIVTSPTAFAGFAGLRVAPNVFTTMAEIDTFVEAMHSALRRGTGAAAG